MAAIHRDVHIHSTYSFDGKSPVRAYIDRARELGLREICITDHQELQIHTRQYRPYDGDGYYAEMIRLREECRGFLDLRLGTELGILSDRVEEARRRAKAYPYDFIILSAHWCDGSPNFYSEPWGSYTNWDVFILHLRRQLEYARIMEDFDVLGHITYYSRRSPYRDKEFRYTDAPDLLDALFQTLIETGRGIEINTSTCGSLGFSMPDYDILRRYRELGGEIVTVGSDAHTAQALGAGLDHAAAILERAGFSHYTTFHGRKPVFHPLEGRP